MRGSYRGGGYHRGGASSSSDRGGYQQRDRSYEGSSSDHKRYKQENSRIQQLGGRLTSNFYRINMLPSRSFHIYSFSCTMDTINPPPNVDIESVTSWAKRMLFNVYFKFRLFSILKKKYEWKSTVEGMNMPFFDGSFIVSIYELSGIPSTGACQVTLDYEREGVTIPFVITVEKQNTLSQTIQGQTQDTQLKQAVSFCLDTLFTMCAGLVQLGTAMCESGNENVVSTRGPNQREYIVKRGVIPSLIQILQGLYISISFKQKIISRATLLETIQFELKNSRNKEEVARRLCGLSIVYNNRSFVIRDIDFLQSPQSTFQRDGKDVSYEQYYKERYNVHIRDKQQPLVMVMVKMRNQKKQKNYLIPELCRVSGIDKKDMRFLPKMSISDRELFVKDIVDKLRSGKAKSMCDQLGIEMENRAMEVSSEILPPSTVKTPQNAPNGWRLSIQQILQAQQKKPSYWVIIGEYISVDRFDRMVYDQQLDLPKPVKISVDNDYDGNEYIKKLQSLKDWENVEFVVVLLPNESKHRYSNLKRFFNSEIGVPSQCIVCNHGWEKRFVNSMCQVLAKMGTLLWSVDACTGDNFKQFISVCGIEVQRRGRNAKGAVSFSLNTNNSMYHTATFRDVEVSEVGNTLMKLIGEGLVAFATRNSGGLPQSIIVYLSGDDIYGLYDHLTNFSQRLTGKSTMAYITVCKDSNARFHQDFQNVGIGTFVKGLNIDEFYLSSTQISSQMGYSRPVRYNIAFNQTLFSLEEISKLTFRQCHLYFNWGGTVRLPACLMYAKKATEVRDVTLESAHERLKNSLHFL